MLCNLQIHSLKCCKKIALLDIIQNKHIVLEVFLDLIKMTYDHLDIINCLTIASFRSAISSFPSTSTFKQDGISKVMLKDNVKLKRGTCQRYVVILISNPGCHLNTNNHSNALQLDHPTQLPPHLI